MEDGEKTYNDCHEDYLRHCGVGAHLKRFGIVDGTVDHIIWKWSRFSSQRAFLVQKLLLSGVYEETPIRDLCAQLNWLYVVLKR
jgi:hypothetical protein